MAKEKYEGLKDNNNALKWTEEKAIELFNKAIDLTNKKETTTVKGREGTSKIEGYKYDFIGEIARELNTFHKVFNYLLDMYPKSLKPLHNILMNNIEQNCYSNTKKGIIREATGIVNLKSNWKWTDRVDTTTKDKEIQPEKTTIKFVKKS